MDDFFVNKKMIVCLLGFVAFFEFGVSRFLSVLDIRQLYCKVTIDPIDCAYEAGLDCMYDLE